MKPTIAAERAKIAALEAENTELQRQLEATTRLLVATQRSLSEDSGEHAEDCGRMAKRLANLEAWMKAANQFAWAHEKHCPRHDRDEPCNFGLHDFLSKPRPFIESFQKRIAELETLVIARESLVSELAREKGELEAHVAALAEALRQLREQAVCQDCPLDFQTPALTPDVAALVERRRLEQAVVEACLKSGHGVVRSGPPDEPCLICDALAALRAARQKKVPHA